MQKSGLAHCCHHDRHWEWCYDYDERVCHIKANKPEEELELRLELFRIVDDDMLPGRDSQEWDAYVKAWDAYAKAGEVYLAKYQFELDDLHDRLFPDCTWDGKSIFKEEN